MAIPIDAYKKNGEKDSNARKACLILRTFPTSEKPPREDLKINCAAEEMSNVL
jgi:hypothetical protein